ncbi:MAG: glycine--tRNA ligase subunit beta [Hyphomonas sp.]
MADLLLEIFCEEIPARMQAKAEADLGKVLGDALTGAGLAFDALETASGPRRLSVNVTGLPVKSADVSEERKGPKVGSPDQAIAGFLKGAGLTSIDQAEIRMDPKKGDFYVAMLDRPGRLTADVVAEAVPAIIRSFHWPKSMRWGTGELRWVRPLQRILCVLDGKVVPFDVDGLASGNETEGHRVHGRGPFTVTGWADYSKQLEGEGHVRLTRDARRDVIAKGIADVCAKAGLAWVEDPGLLEEVTGLAEWPVVILGDMDPAFLDLPPEVITLSMRTHQKYFAVNDKKTGQLAPHFIVVANIDASDGGKQIAAGNARVLSARLEDGRFFWEKDKATPLDEMAAKLSTIAFKEELGSLGDKVERVAALARELAPAVGADADLAERAARLAKADLVSEMVGEFPELQGVMGRYYALAAGEKPSVADAVRDHYKPQGPSDAVPTDPVAIAVALADKLDTLVGFWAIDEKPTGSKDPFALRRAALGIVRIMLENRIPIYLRYFIEKHFDVSFERDYLDVADSIDNLEGFFEDRLSVALRDAGGRHDLVDAALSIETGAEGGAIFTRVVQRVEALGAFLDTEDGATLLAGYKRAANILKAEEKKGALPENLSVDAALIKTGPKEEQALYTALTAVRKAIETPLKAEDFAGAMGELAKLRSPVDAFFEGVMVNDEDAAVRANRLALLTEVRATLHQVADFSLIEG